MSWINIYSVEWCLIYLRLFFKLNGTFVSNRRLLLLVLIDICGPFHLGYIHFSLLSAILSVHWCAKQETAGCLHFYLSWPNFPLNISFSLYKPRWPSSWVLHIYWKTGKSASHSKGQPTKKKKKKKKKKSALFTAKLSEKGFYYLFIYFCSLR